MIIRGTTQVHSFPIPFAAEDIGAMYLTYKQYNGPTIEKSLKDITFEEPGIAKVHFSQNDTLSFKPYTVLNSDVIEIQGRTVLTNGKAYATEPYKERLKDVFKEGFITASSTPTPPTPDTPEDDDDNEIIYDGGGVSG